jgi:hypothetical protein
MLEYDLVILAVPMAWLLGEALRDGFRRGEAVALLGAFLAPVLFKITPFDSALRLGAIAAAALLFAAVLRRMTEQPRNFQAAAAVVSRAEKFSASATPSGF